MYYEQLLTDGNIYIVTLGPTTAKQQQQIFMSNVKHNHTHNNTYAINNLISIQYHKLHQ